ncbi:hypothetical protein DFJ74DRAFT_688257 [Hyaloraphidium curvatum]|nr:hypothetical protein DFJ74DRAFT_688257 [Hyaloraphidium curvatum]
MTAQFLGAVLYALAVLSCAAAAPLDLGLPRPTWLPSRFPLARFSRHASMAQNVHLYWHLEKEADRLLVGVAASFDHEAKGTWLGVGLSPTGGMKGSDIVVGFTKHSGEFAIQNRHAGGFYQPQLSALQFVELAFGTQEGNVTAFVFSRPLAIGLPPSCSDSDSELRQWINPDLRLQQWIIFASGSMSPDRLAPMYHGPADRGQIAVFFDGPGPLQGDDDSTEKKVIELRPSEPINLPSNESTVYCYTYLELPSGEPYDAVSLIPILPARDAAIAMRPHHFIIYNCRREDARRSAAEQFASTKCFTPGHGPQLYTPCERVWAGWATGGGPLKMPPDVGMPLPSAVVLETHYDGHGSHGAGGEAADNSGMRIEYTPELRPKEMSVIELGVLNSAIFVPAGRESYSLVAVCPGICTAGLNSGVKVAANWFHMHAIGSAASTYLLRRRANGTTSRIDLGSVTDFDNSYQSQQLLFPDSAPELLPGDTAVSTFTWDSRSRREVTPGGLSTQEEMAINFLHVVKKRGTEAADFGQCYAAEPLQDPFEGTQGVYCDGTGGGDGPIPAKLPEGWTREADREARCSAAPARPPAAHRLLWPSVFAVFGLFAAIAFAMLALRELRRGRVRLPLRDQDGQSLLGSGEGPGDTESREREEENAVIIEQQRSV